MLITRTSILSGKSRTYDLPVVEEQLAEMELPSQMRRNVQEIFPQLSPDEREFIKTGITPDEWHDALGGDE